VLFAWGDNQYGQLGFSMTSFEKQPDTRHNNKKASLSEMVRHSELPHILNSTHVTVPRQLPDFGRGEKVVSFSCGENFTLFKTECVGKEELSSENLDIPSSTLITHNFYACGLNTHGQCGLPVVQDLDATVSKNILVKPTRIFLPKTL
jgi:alpha-tubulin suppressor-like RCC1 family protein